MDAAAGFDAAPGLRDAAFAADALPVSVCLVAAEGQTLALTCPVGLQIVSIDEAVYGAGAGAALTCDRVAIGKCYSQAAVDVVECACRGRAGCRLPVTDNALGPGCGDQGRRLLVRATCGAAGASVPRATVCGEADEGNTLSLTCPSGTIVTGIEFASYGLGGGSCVAPAVATCEAPTSGQRVAWWCLGRRSCLVPAHNDLFGDPCPGRVKRLVARAICQASAAASSRAAPPACLPPGPDLACTRVQGCALIGGWSMSVAFPPASEDGAVWACPCGRLTRVCRSRAGQGSCTCSIDGVEVPIQRCELAP